MAGQFGSALEGAVVMGMEQRTRGADFKAGKGESVRIGTINPNGQRCLGHQGVKGTDHGQKAYGVHCTKCHHEYGANGTDMHERRCPACQGGAPGIPYLATATATDQESKSLLNLAGEFAVASELNRRGVHAAVTYGASKRADIFAIGKDSERLVRVEVKCTDKGRWPIGARGATPPAVEGDRVRWVFVLMPPPLGPAPTAEARADATPRYFVLTPAEVFAAFKRGADKYNEGYRAKHGKDYDKLGMPNLLIADVEPFESRWDLIVDVLNAE